MQRLNFIIETFFRKLKVAPNQGLRGITVYDNIKDSHDVFEAENAKSGKNDPKNGFFFSNSFL